MVVEAKKSVGKKGKPTQQPRPSPILNIQKIGSLKRYPDQEHANSLLHEVVKLVAPIIHENKFKVGTLCEMFPKNPNLLGLNVNRGQKILIRLRYHSNDRLFYPMGDIIGTFLHELTHNIHGPHDNKFYKFLDKLQERFEQIQMGGISSGYFCEEQTLGSKFNANGLLTIREKRLKALGKGIFKAEVRKLGSLATRGETTQRPKNLKQAILAAAERRQKDSKWCSLKLDRSLVEPSDNEVEIMEINLDDEKGNTKENINNEYLEIIDLTNEEYPNMITNRDEVIVIDGCENSESNAPDRKTKSQYKKNVRFSGLDASFDDEKTGFSHSKDSSETNSDGTEEEVHYRSSFSPGRSFIQNEDLYPRRKLVADLNFNQILMKGSTIRLEEIQEIKDVLVGQSNVTILADSIQSIPNHESSKSLEITVQENASQSKAKHKSKHKPKSKKRKASNNNNSNTSKTKTNEVHKTKKHVKSISFEDLL